MTARRKISAPGARPVFHAVSLLFAVFFIISAIYPAQAYAQPASDTLSAYGPQLFAETPFVLRILPGSSISFYAKATAHWFTGTTQKIEGEFFIQEKAVLADRPNRLKIPVNTIRTGINMRDVILKRTLVAPQHPNILFELKEFEILEKINGLGEFKIKVIGDLTIRGVTRSEEFTILMKTYRNQVLITGETDINLGDYQIEIPTFFFFFSVEPQITIKWSIESLIEFIIDKPADK